MIVKYATPIALTTRKIEKASNADKELRNLRNCILSNDWLKLDCKSYLPVRSELTTIGFIVLRRTRIVIPSELREHVLKLAHEGHPGIVMMKKRDCDVKYGGLVLIKIANYFVKNVMVVN